MDPRQLPPQIADYYRRCVPHPPQEPRGTLLEQQGEMRLAPDRPWMPFTAEQSISATRTQFCWHARFKMAPLVTGVVEDAFENGRGRLDAKVWGILPVAHGRGLEVDRGEAQRYLAELVWCPMAFLHNRELRLRAIDAGTVRAWIGDEATHVDLHFNDQGDIVATRTDTRARGKGLVQPWEGRFYDFKDFGDLRAPSHAEVSWQTPEGRFLYWRGTVTSLRSRTSRTLVNRPAGVRGF